MKYRQNYVKNSHLKPILIKRFWWSVPILKPLELVPPSPSSMKRVNKKVSPFMDVCSKNVFIAHSHHKMFNFMIGSRNGRDFSYKYHKERKIRTLNSNNRPLNPIVVYGQLPVLKTFVHGNFSITMCRKTSFNMVN